eukprot:EG_transcript_28354
MSPNSALAALQRQHARALLASPAPVSPSPLPCPVVLQPPPLVPTPGPAGHHAYFALLRQQSQLLRSPAAKPNQHPLPSPPQGHQGPALAERAVAPPRVAEAAPCGWSPFSGPQWLPGACSAACGAG